MKPLVDFQTEDPETSLGYWAVFKINSLLRTIHSLKFISEFRANEENSSLMITTQQIISLRNRDR